LLWQRRRSITIPAIHDNELGYFYALSKMSEHDDDDDDDDDDVLII